MMRRTPTSTLFPYTTLFRSAANSQLAQTVPINGGDNFQFHVSLSKSTRINSPIIYVQVLYLNNADVVVGRGLDIEIAYDSIPSILDSSWLDILLVTDPAPATATQARVDR